MKREDLETIRLNTVVDDELIGRKREQNSGVQTYKGVPLPSIVEISESGTCNRSCSFCPRSAPGFVDRKEFISPMLIHKIGSELHSLDYEGLILFSGFVEPLLDVNIKDHIRTLREFLPNARIELVTNGDPITITNVCKIFEAGLDCLLVSCYDGAHQIDEIGKLMNQAGISLEKIRFRKRWEATDGNFGLSLSNRGGQMKSAEFPVKDLSEPWNQSCFYPAYTFFMDYNGDVLMCAHDWGKKSVMGNLRYRSFWEIWTGQAFQKARTNLINANRSFSPCNVCNVEGTRMGANHAHAWSEGITEIG